MAATFQELGVPLEFIELLNTKNITVPTPIQAATMQDAMRGNDLCGRAPTGSGKTIAFGIPIITGVAKAASRKPTGLILAPTRELAEQITSELQGLAQLSKRSMLAVYGGTSIRKHKNRLNKGVDILVACPGRLNDLLQQKALTLDEVSFVVIDEADRMADMGFMPQVEWVLRQVEVDHQTLLFSATLDGMVSGLISRYQHDPAMHEVDSREVTVAEMQHRFIAVHEMDQVKVAAAIINSSNKTIVFTKTRWGADKLASKLLKENVDAAAIHGDLRQSQREKALKDFTKGKIRSLVATDVAARGIHVDDVEAVIHYDPASDAKTYLHRSGRTARAGGSGVVVSLICWDEELEIRKLMRRLGLKQPIVEMFSNDERLKNLIDWNPDLEAN